MAMRPLPTVDRLRQLFTYDEEAGLLFWNERPVASFKGTPAKKKQAAGMWNKRCAGKVAGTKDRAGYVIIKVDDRPIQAHRIIWAIAFGQWPEIIDHINGQPGDNRLSNLRNCDRRLNQRNQKRHRTNTSGRTGVAWDRFRGCWVAYIRMGGTQFNLGGYNSFEDAVNARLTAEKQNGFTGRQ